MPQKYYMEKIIMKVKVIKPAFYNLEYLTVGRIIELKEKNLPSWAEPIKKAKKDETENEPEKNEKPEQTEPEAPAETSDIIPDSNNKPATDETEEKPEQTEPEAEMYLELLLNEAMNKNIFIQDTDKKSVSEQIKELEELLGVNKGETKCV